MVDTPLARRLLALLWSSFLMAGVLEMVVFSVIDPSHLQGHGGFWDNDWPASAIYTLAFLVFWGATAASGLMALWLELDAEAVNRRSGME
ncbi:MAG: hypothetical protein ACKVQR_16865 [Aquabacterium sp.]